MGAVYVIVGCEGEVEGLKDIYIYISACVDIRVGGMLKFMCGGKGFLVKW